MVHELSISYVKTAELAALLRAYITTYKASNTNHPLIDSLIPVLEDELEKLEQYLAQSTRESLAQQKDAADDARDASYEAFKENVEGHLRLPDEMKTVREAAGRIWAVIQGTGQYLEDENDDEQTGLMNSLFKELDQKQYQKDMQLSFLPILYNDMKTKQASFIKIQAEHRALGHVNRKNITLKEAIEAPRKHVPTFLTNLDIMVSKEPAKHTKLVNAINLLTDKTMTRINTRKTKGEGKESETPEVPTPETNTNNQ